MLVKVYGSAVFGVEATTITIEVNIKSQERKLLSIWLLPICVKKVQPTILVLQ